MFAIELPVGTAISPAKREQYSHRPLQIALIEDNPEVAVALSFALRKQSHHVVAAPSLRELLPQLDDHGVDIVISDYRLAPEENGIQVIQALRSRLRPDLPAIIITGETDPALLRRVAEAGIALLRKPLDLESLRATIASISQRDSLMGVDAVEDNPAWAMSGSDPFA